MFSPAPKDDRETTTPFLLRLFYRAGTFHRPEEFASLSPPPYVSVYTWPDCTLNELALELAAFKPSILPTPAVGTRLAFQLVCPDLRATSAISNAHPRFAVRNLGSLVIGEGGPGAEADVDAAGAQGMALESEKTLSDARFVVGDYVSCAVLPPLADGSVAPASSAIEAPSSLRDGRSHRGGFPGRENGFGRGGGRGGRGDWSGGGGAGFPMGEWKRGERLPEGPGNRSRGRGRW